MISMAASRVRSANLASPAFCFVPSCFTSAALKHVATPCVWIRIVKLTSANDSLLRGKKQSLSLNCVYVKAFQYSSPSTMWALKALPIEPNDGHMRCAWPATIKLNKIENRGGICDMRCNSCSRSAQIAKQATPILLLHSIGPTDRRVLLQFRVPQAWLKHCCCNSMPSARSERIEGARHRRRMVSLPSPTLLRSSA